MSLSDLKKLLIDFFVRIFSIESFLPVHICCFRHTYVREKVVLEYLDGKGGVQYLSKKYGLGSNSQLRKWINAYNAFGDEGLMRSRKQTKYSFEKKISVVELYLSSEISYQDLAIQEGINNPSMIANWVNRFRTAGPDALKSRRKGRKKTLISLR